MEILGEHIVIQKGKMPKNLSDEPSKKFIFPYVDIKAFEKKNIQRYTDGEKCLLCNDNDLLIVWDGARCGLVGKAIRGAVGSTIAVIRPKETLHKEYAYYFLKSQFRTFNTRVKGVGIPHLDPLIVHHSSLIIPSLPEQHRIVAKIEELFSDLDNGIENLKTAQQQLKTYRQAVLKYAFDGRFTNKKVKDGELPEGWKWEKLSDLTEVKDGTHDTPKYIDDGIPFVTQKNIKESGLTFSDIKCITQSDHDKFYKRSNVSLNDILISMIGANRGMSCIVNDSRIFSIKNVGLIKSNERTIVVKYLLYFLKSHYSKNYIKSLSKGGAQEFVGLTELRKFPIVFCNIREQKLIVDEIESRLSVCDKVEETITASLQQSESLRQSILKKAFEGKLV